MMRWVFNIFTLLSFLLCVATVVLWVRSYTWLSPHYLSFAEGSSQLSLDSRGRALY